MKNKMKNDVAEKYLTQALNDCLKVRKQRKSIYGNCWFQEDGVEANFWGGIMNKVNRIKILHKNRFNSNVYESYDDTLIDLVILTLFTLACARYEKDEKVKHTR